MFWQTEFTGHNDVGKAYAELGMLQVENLQQHHMILRQHQMMIVGLNYYKKKKS